MRLLRAATLTVPDPDETMATYAQWLDYVAIERGVVDDDLAASFGTPGSAGSAYVIGRPASGSDVLLRFIEGEPVPAYQPLRSYGWAAIELCVQDTDAVHMRLAESPFTVIGPPRRLDGLPGIYPMQVRGPADEIVYLTQITADPPDCRLPRAQSAIDQLFIIVLACSNLKASITWFAGALGLQISPPVDIVYSMLNKSFGLDSGHRHTIVTGLDELDCFLELDQYPDGATARPGPPDRLPAGVALASLWHRAIDSIAADWIVPPKPYAGLLYGGRRAGVLRAPDDTLVEIIEVL